MEISGHGFIFAFKRVTFISQQSYPSLSNETRRHVRHPAGSSQPSHRCGGRQYRSPSNCSSVLFSLTKSSLPTDLMLLGIVTCLLGAWLAQMSFSEDAGKHLFSYGTSYELWLVSSKWSSSKPPEKVVKGGCFTWTPDYSKH